MRWQNEIIACHGSCWLFGPAWYSTTINHLFARGALPTRLTLNSREAGGVRYSRLTTVSAGANKII